MEGLGEALMTLKSELDHFSQLFKGHLNGSMKATLRWVSATEVDWDAQTMTAVDGDGLEFFDVLLGVGTTAVKPVVGTDCLIAIVEGDEATAFLLFADEAELIQLNGGELGGLIKITPTIAWMKKVNLDMQVLKTLLSGIGLAFNSQTPNPQQSDFENEKITH
jgi:hypothetical protein